MSVFAFSSSLAVRMEVLREKVEEEEAEREEATERAERTEKLERVTKSAEVSREGTILSQDELRDLEGKLMAIEIPTQADHS